MYEKQSKNEKCLLQSLQHNQLITSLKQPILFTGSMEEIVTNIVNIFWEVKVIKIQYLVGYDVSNYLVICQNGSNSKDMKLVVKIYRDCSSRSIGIVQTQNWVLNQLIKSNERCVYPRPLELSGRKSENEKKMQETGKLIINNIKKNKVEIQHQSWNKNKEQDGQQVKKQKQQQSSMQDIIGLNININQKSKLINLNTLKELQYQNIHISSEKSRSKIRTVTSQDDQQIFGKIVNIQVNGGKPETVYVRSLVYIEGTMLCDIISKQNEQQSISYQKMILEQLPRQIGTDITIPLQKVSVNCKNHLGQNKQSIECMYKNRELPWYTKSFIEKPEYFKARYNMIKVNPSRQHYQVIQYFIDLYTHVLKSIDLNQVRLSLIHNDLNDWNIIQLAQQDRRFAAIDYGNMVYSYIVQDIAIYTTYILYHNPTYQGVKQKLRQIVSSYSEVVPISMDQLKILYICIPIRMCISLCNSQHSLSKNPNNEYTAISQKYGWKLLIILKQLYTNNQSGQNIKLFQSSLWHSVVKSVRFISHRVEMGRVAELENNSRKQKFRINQYYKYVIPLNYPISPQSSTLP